jgi:hypothetical protein
MMWEKPSEVPREYKNSTPKNMKVWLTAEEIED